MSIWNPFSWFKKSSKGERKLVALLNGLGWNAVVNSWASNRHELVNQYRGWSYVAIHAFAECIAEQIPQVAWVEDESKVKSQLNKAWFSTKDQFRRAKRISKVRSKFLSRQRRKNAMAAIQEGDELIPCPQDDRLVRLLKKPNSYDTQWSFNYRLAMWLRLAGGCYIRLIPGNDGTPAEMWPISPNWLKPVGGKDRIIEEWEIQPILSGHRDEMSWGWMLGSGGKERIPAEEIVQIGYPHPQHAFDFYSPQEACATWVDCAEAIGKSRVAQFQNGAYPGVVLQLDSDAEQPDDTVMDRVKAKFKAAYAGVMNRGEPVILAPGMTLVPFSQSAVEMDFVNSESQMKDHILAMHRTGGSIVGLAEQTSYASMIASRAHYYQGVIRPTLKFISAVYNAFVIPKFQDESDERQRVLYYEDPTPKDPAQVNADMQADYAMQAITPNEVRAERGREPFPHGGDDPMANMGIGPIPWHSGHEDDWLPVPAKEEPQEGGLPGMPGQEQPAQDEPTTQMPSQLAALFGRGKHLNGNGKPEVEAPPALTKSDIDAALKKAMGSVIASVGSVADQFKAELQGVRAELAEKTQALEKALAKPSGKAIKLQRDEDGLVVGVVEEVLS